MHGRVAASQWSCSAASRDLSTLLGLGFRVRVRIRVRVRLRGPPLPGDRPGTLTLTLTLPLTLTLTLTLTPTLPLTSLLETDLRAIFALYYFDLGPDVYPG